MGNDNLELANMNVIQKGVQDLLNCVRTEVNMNSCSPSIYMVPGVIRDPRAFDPLVVSIGPLHREDQNVQAFEKQKAIFLNSLLNRIAHSPAHEILQICMLKAHDSMKQIRACYDWRKTYDDAEVAKMMVMDACFILEFIHWFEEDRSYPGINLRPETVMCDLVLLENQIPFFFLDEIYKCTIMKTQSDRPLIQFIHPLLNDLRIFKKDIKLQSNTESSFKEDIKPQKSNTTYHILSLLHQCYKPPEYIKPSFSTPPSIHSAIDLDMVGVNFKPDKHPEWVMGIKVKRYRLPYLSVSWGKPTLEMSAFSMNDDTELVLRNLIAYEQSCKTYHITSYVRAMDMLVNTKEDMDKLVESEVIHNETGSNEVAANIINNISNGLICAGFFYDEQWKTLDKYCKGYWPKHIAWLRRTYFSSPWSIIALLAGIILFALTVVQTIFSIKST